MSETQIRYPRMHGFPKQMFGSMLIRSNNFSWLMRASRNCGLSIAIVAVFEIFTAKERERMLIEKQILDRSAAGGRLRSTQDFGRCHSSRVPVIPAIDATL